MDKTRELKCCKCGELFKPDYRNRRRQVCCRRKECRKSMKSARQRRWLSKSENKDYFRGSEHVQRVRDWRAKHPEYWKRKKIKGGIALQDALPTQTPNITPDYSTLQDALPSQAPDNRSVLKEALSNQFVVLIGLIGNLYGTTLQDDIDKATSNLLRLGNDILRTTEARQNDL